MGGITEWESGRWGDGQMGRSGDSSPLPLFPSPTLPLSHSPHLPFSPSLLAAAFLILVAPPHYLPAAAPPPAAPPSPEKLHRLIEALGDANYFVRQKAEAELGKIGFEALDALTAATDHDDLEVAARANRLVYAIRSDWTVPGEPPDVSRLLAEYDAQDDAGREARINQLVALPGNEGLPAICRIVRFERSLPLAKAAALCVMGSKESTAPKSRAEAKPEWAGVFEKGMASCHRAPAAWIMGWMQARQDPQALAAFWTQLAGEESGLRFRQPRDTSAAVVESLLRLQIAALRNAGRDADAARSIESLINLRRAEPSSLATLLGWLIAQKDWPATRIVENRCRMTIDESADLLYLVAEAQAGRGEAALAEQTAGRARGLSPGSDESSLGLHLQAGAVLEDRGRFAWAASEWEHVMQAAPPQSALTIEAARVLAELYHDQDQDRQAADALARIEKAFASRSNQSPLPGQEGGDTETLGRLTARRCFFEACRWKAEGDRARQRAALDKALATQSYDIEVLIECYHLPGAAAEYQAKTRALIAKRLCELREQAADMGDNPAAAQTCNEFAWLAANTEGDLDEALRFSNRSLALAGDRGAFCDTLGRVYFAKGDYVNALRRQMQAAELMPHNRAVEKQLELFRRTAREKGIAIEKIEKIEKSQPARDSRPPAEESPSNNPFGQ
jgi:hypothetical protein